MWRTPLRGSKRPTKTIVRWPSTAPSGGASGEKKVVSTPFGMTSHESSGKEGDSESTLYVNLPASKKVGAEFNSQLLGVATVIR
jgi:hypothetical protein